MIYDEAYNLSLCVIQGERSEPWVLGENSGRLLPIDSEMAGPIWLKIGGMVEGMQENVLAKIFFGSVEVDQGKVSRPRAQCLSQVS